MLDFKRLQIVGLVKTVFVATFALMFVVIPKVTNAANCVDIGLFIRENGSLAKICAENRAETNSPLHISKSGSIYGIALVDIGDPNATKARIRIPGGITKALKRYVVNAVSGIFNDQTVTAIGHPSGGNTVFYSTFVITNTTSNTYSFVRISTSNIDPIHVGSSPASFTINPNETISKNMGSTISFPGSLTRIPDSPWIQGSATYSVQLNGVEVDQVTYTWVYPQ